MGTRCSPLQYLLIGIVSGATAAVVGFGIGSLLTPLLVLRVDAETAVAAVTIPHAAAAAVRCWRLRASVDGGVLARFGLLGAAGALAGAALYTQLGGSTLTRIVGGLLVLTAIAQLTGWSSRWKARGPMVPLLGLLSGFFGGVAGNQGGLRAAALTAFSLTPKAFVATSTAAGLLIDLVRMPVYLLAADRTLAPLAGLIIAATIGVLIGTVLGERILLGLSTERFAQVIGAAVGLLGVWLLAIPP